MVLWSIVMILAIGLWRARNLGQLLGVITVTAFILLVSQALFMHLSLTIGAAPADALLNPAYYLGHGPLGWLALLIMPCGWLGPIIGLNLVQRRDPVYENT
jgi:hypothetical protein